MALIDSLIFDLDQSLDEVGESVTLRRTVGIQLIPFDVKCKMILRGYTPQELIGEIIQQDQMFITSPTEMIRHKWPGFRTGRNPDVDDRIPRKNDVIVSTRGRLTVQAAAGIYIQDVLVRIEGRVRGN